MHTRYLDKRECKQVWYLHHKTAWIESQHLLKIVIHLHLHVKISDFYHTTLVVLSWLAGVSNNKGKMNGYQQGKCLACLYDQIFYINTPISMKSQSQHLLHFVAELDEKTVTTCSEVDFF